MRVQLERDFERFRGGLPADLAAHVREAYRIDLTARYLGFTLPHPIGKGSGQLSLSQEQLETDRAAMEAENPKSSLTGKIVGAVTGPAAQAGAQRGLGRIGEQGAKASLAPQRHLAGGRLQQRLVAGIGQ